MDSLSFYYQIANSPIQITLRGIEDINLEGSLFNLFRTVDPINNHDVLFEVHVLEQSIKYIDIIGLISRFHLDSVSSHWIDIWGDHWLAFFSGQDRRFILFLDDFRFFPDAYENALQFSFRHISKVDRLFFHGAGIQIANRCSLFLAPSGTGKTTLSLRAQTSSLPVLSDEAVIVSKNGGCFVAYSSPFGRISDGPLEAPLGGIFFLKQGTATKFSRVNPSQALARAWQDSYYRDTVFDLPNQKLRFKNRIVTPAERLKIFNLWHDLFSTIPCFEMEFPIDFDDWHKLVELIENA